MDNCPDNLTWKFHALTFLTFHFHILFNLPKFFILKLQDLFSSNLVIFFQVNLDLFFPYYFLPGVLMDNILYIQFPPTPRLMNSSSCLLIFQVNIFDGFILTVDLLIQISSHPNCWSSHSNFFIILLPINILILSFIAVHTFLKLWLSLNISNLILWKSFFLFILFHILLNNGSYKDFS